ncbi:ATPase Cu transporting protein 7B, partial [Phlyctochytrium bullatum]
MTGVISASVDLKSEMATVSFDPALLESWQIISTIEDCGFEAFESDTPHGTDEKTKTARIMVKGMTCNSCVQSIESQLKPLSGVISASVDLKAEIATVSFDPAMLNTQQIISTIEDCGFDAFESDAPGTETTKTARITVKGMTCNSCVQSIESQLKPMTGVISASVDLKAEIATVSFDPAMLNTQQIISTIEDCGFDAFESDAPGTETTKTARITVKGMTCNSCVQSIESQLKPMTG